MCEWQSNSCYKINMELPVVNHKDYFAKIGDDHKFPIYKFGDLAKFLLVNCIFSFF